MNEIWKDIEDYEGLYQVSNMGRVKSLHRTVSTTNGNRNYKGMILKPLPGRHGYLCVDIWDTGVKKRRSIHRLVANAFIGNPLNLPVINHIDENIENNTVSNLEFCTYKYNRNYGSCIERNAKSHSKPILQFSKGGVYLDEYASAREAKMKTGISYAHISSCCIGRIKSAGGFVWKFKNIKPNNV
jgi:hypothetical protein